jgi:DNA-binding transcriptional LysR family regulator
MSINVDLDKLKSFVAVGEELHFTRAAQHRLHVSQPWLSRSVRSLEQKLGVQLFERHSRHVELTAPGRRLLYGARKIIHDFDRTVSAVVREKRANGHVVVGYSPYVDLRFMTELKEVIQGESETVNVSFESAPSEEITLRVLNREWDCGIVVLPLGTSDLEIIPLFKLPLAAALQKTHRLARRRVWRLEDLQNEGLILQRHDLHFRGWLLHHLAEAGVKPRIVTEATSPHEAQYLVTRGTGIALANSGAFRTTLEGIVVRPFHSDSVQTYTALVVRKGRHSSALGGFVNRVLQMARTRGQGRPAMRSVA